MKIYHIVLPAVWENHQPELAYEAASLQSEGFIHCSYTGQLGAVLDRYYRGAGRVLVLEIDTDRLTSALVAEASTANEIFPHIYGAINPEAIVGMIERHVD